MPIIYNREFTENRTDSTTVNRYYSILTKNALDVTLFLNYRGSLFNMHKEDKGVYKVTYFYLFRLIAPL